MDDLTIAGTVVIPATDLTWQATRAGGPGGQHVNKVSSKVDLRFDVVHTSAISVDAKARLVALAGVKRDAEGRIVVISALSRSQIANLNDARAKLRAMILKALSPRKRRKRTKPSRAAKRRRLDAKSKQKQKKAQRGRVRYDG